MIDGTRAFSRILLGTAAMLLIGSATDRAFAQATPSPNGPAWNIRDHIPLKDVVIQSHRGAGFQGTDNTREAFEIGWQIGTIPEADVRTTRDGVLVGFHDNNFARVVKNASPELKKKGIADLTWAELQTLDVGSWKGDAFAGHRIPRLSDVFASMTNRPERRIYLDVKNVRLETLAAEIQRAGIENRVILASTDYAFIRKWKKLAPASGTLLWMGGSEKKLNERFVELRKTNFADVTQLQIHVNVIKKPEGETLSPSESFLRKAGEELRQHGIVFQSLPWGRSDAETYHRLMDLGVASFATDFPDKTLEAVRSYYAKRPGAAIRTPSKPVGECSAR